MSSSVNRELKMGYFGEIQLADSAFSACGPTYYWHIANHTDLANVHTYFFGWIQFASE